MSVIKPTSFLQDAKDIKNKKATLAIYLKVLMLYEFNSSNGLILYLLFATANLTKIIKHRRTRNRKIKYIEVSAAFISYKYQHKHNRHIFQYAQFE